MIESARLALAGVSLWVRVAKKNLRRPSRTGVPNLWATDWYRFVPVRNWATQQELSLNVMHLNHPETIPHPYCPICGKIVSHEARTWC